MDTETYLKEHQKFLLRLEALKLIAKADSLGLVLNLEQKPLLPLAMGNYMTVVSVWEVRK